MTLFAIIIVLSIFVFILAFISPRKGTKAQRHSLGLVQGLLKKVDNFPGFLRTVVTKPPIWSHKTIHKSAGLGKAARHKTEKKVVDPLKAKAGAQQGKLK
jgi:hypothetical protein